MADRRDLVSIKFSMILQSFKRRVNQYINRRGAEQLPVTFNWRRIYVLPSKAGLFFGVIWFLMMLAGLNFNNNMTLMLVFLLFGLAQVILHKTFFNLRNIRMEQIHAEPAHLGEPAEIRVQLNADNQKYQIQTSNALSQDVTDIDQSPAQLHALVMTTQRGWQALDRIKILTRYPMGLFTVWAYCTPAVSILVYPKPEQPCPPFPNHGGLEGDLQTPVKGEEISGIRNYHPGDPIRDIAWKKSAQSDQTWVKQFNQTQGKHLRFDFSQFSMNNVELKLSRLTAWVLAADQQQLEYQLTLPGFTSAMSSGEQHKHQCLQALALFQAGGDA